MKHNFVSELFESYRKMQIGQVIKGGNMEKYGKIGIDKLIQII